MKNSKKTLLITVGLVMTMVGFSVGLYACGTSNDTVIRADVVGSNQ